MADQKLSQNITKLFPAEQYEYTELLQCQFKRAERTGECPKKPGLDTSLFLTPLNPKQLQFISEEVKNGSGLVHNFFFRSRGCCHIDDTLMERLLKNTSRTTLDGIPPDFFLYSESCYLFGYYQKHIFRPEEGLSPDMSIQFIKDRPERMLALITVTLQYLHKNNTPVAELFHHYFVPIFLLTLKNHEDPAAFIIGTTDQTFAPRIMTIAGCMGFHKIYDAFKDRGLSPEFPKNIQGNDYVPQLKKHPQQDLLDTHISDEDLYHCFSNFPPSVWKNRPDRDSGLTVLERCIKKNCYDKEIAKYKHTYNPSLQLLGFLSRHSVVSESFFANLNTNRRDHCSILCCLLLNRPDIYRTYTHSSAALNDVISLLSGLKLAQKTDYIQFMDRLVDWQPNYKNQWMEAYSYTFCYLNNKVDFNYHRVPIPENIKHIRPELLQLCSTTESLPCANFDPVGSDLENGRYLADALEGYLQKTSWLKYRLMTGFLEHGSKDAVTALMKHWIIDNGNPGAEHWLFEQNIHPNHTHLYEHIPCNSLLQGCLTILPEAQPPADFPRQSNFNYRLSIESQDEMPEPIKTQMPVAVFGRTLVWKTGKKNHYLKIQLPDEEPVVFDTQCSRMHYIHDQSTPLGLKSPCGKVEGLYSLSPDTIPMTDDQKKALPHKNLERDYLAVHFSLPADVHYELYTNSPTVTAQEAWAGLVLDGWDAGTLWANGINPQDALSAFHDLVNKREYSFTPELGHCLTLGLMNITHITRHPNTGPSGSRDQMDVTACDENVSDYFVSKSRDDFPLSKDSARDRNRVRIDKLWKKAWGHMFLCHERYKMAENSGSQLDLSALLQEALSPLFCRSFRINEQDIAPVFCGTLYAQTIREVIYWMDKTAPSRDALDSRIPREVYPLLSPKMKTIKLNKTQSEFVSERMVSKEHRLGVLNSGINPLLAFNALLVKLTAIGAVLSAEQESAAMDIDNPSV